MERLAEAKAGFRSLTEAIDTTRPAGRMMMQMVVSFAEFERAMLRERTKIGLEAGAAGVPAVIAAAGEQASWRYLEFFTANIRNPHTRRAYGRACARFFAWCARRRFGITDIRPLHVAAYIEGCRTKRRRRASSRSSPRSGCFLTGWSWARWCR
jgi:hypothetical protein